MEKITILGGGLVGSLLSVYLSNHGFKVEVFERRNDPRVAGYSGGRSINLALSDRGFRGLAGANKDLLEEVKKNAIPMKGRMVHDEEGKVTLQPYGREGQNIYSISRALLNELLIDFAEKRSQVQFNFNHRTVDVDLSNGTIVFDTGNLGSKTHVTSGVTFGADGAYSTLRSSFQKADLFDYSQSYLEYGYKELSIPGKNGEHLIEKNALHIWPRKSFMLIALPNLDGSFTCTLFLPFKGKHSFASLSDRDELNKFFNNYFSDTLPLMPNLEEEFFSNPTSSLVTIKCFPWSLKGKYCLIGDAAHAIVPFYGQGMNAGFEDCTILNEILSHERQDWSKILERFQQSRKRETDAIAELAVRNFEEMRDLVIDEGFLLRKKIEAKLHQLFPKEWIPLYTMVTFSHLPYSEALRLGKLQDEIMREVLDISGIETSWENLDFEAVIKKYMIAQNI